MNIKMFSNNKLIFVNVMCKFVMLLEFYIYENRFVNYVAVRF